MACTQVVTTGIDCTITNQYTQSWYTLHINERL